MASHPLFSRRVSLQAGASTILGLGEAEWRQLRSAPASHGHRAVVFVFLSGGLAQHESFDPKPDAPDTIRGEFGTIATKIPGVRVRPSSCLRSPPAPATPKHWLGYGQTGYWHPRIFQVNSDRQGCS